MTTPVVKRRTRLHMVVPDAPPLLSYADLVLSDNPSSYYRMDTPSLSDASGNGRHGTFYNDPVKTTGVLADNSATRFMNASLEYAVAPVGSLSGTSASVEIWGRSNGGGYNTAAIFWRDGTSSTSGWFLRFDTANFNVRHGSFTWDTGVSSAPARDGAWHHYVVTIGASDIAFYLDGQLRAIRARGSSTASQSSFYLAKNGTVSGQYTSCDLDEVAFYTYPLSGEQVLSHYNRALGIS